MDNKQLNEIIARLDQTAATLEEAYIETGGEVTEETVTMENNIADLRELLEGDGVDMLGRWLKAKEDRKKALKAEKDYVTRQIAAVDGTVEYIKGQLNAVLSVLGKDKIKGLHGYSFTATTSTTTTVDKTVLAELYGAKIEEAVRGAGVPNYVRVSLTASATIAKDSGVLEGDEGIFTTTSAPSVRFLKPKASKEA